SPAPGRRCCAWAAAAVWPATSVWRSVTTRPAWRWPSTSCCRPSAPTRTRSSSPTGSPARPRSATSPTYGQSTSPNCWEADVPEKPRLPHLLPGELEPGDADRLAIERTHDGVCFTDLDLTGEKLHDRSLTECVLSGA